MPNVTYQDPIATKQNRHLNGLIELNSVAMSVLELVS